MNTKDLNAQIWTKPCTPAQIAKLTAAAIASGASITGTHWACEIHTIEDELAGWAVRDDNDYVFVDDICDDGYAIFWSPADRDEVIEAIEAIENK